MTHISFGSTVSLWASQMPAGIGALTEDHTPASSGFKTIRGPASGPGGTRKTRRTAMRGWPEITLAAYLAESAPLGFAGPGQFAKLSTISKIGYGGLSLKRTL